MGSCFSKSPVDEKSAPPKKRFQSANKLGEKQSVAPKTTNSKEPETAGHKLGSREGSSTTTADAKEAARRAAEERYEKLKEINTTSETKLKQMSKISRADKGL